MSATKEQIAAIDTIQLPSCTFLQISACSGSGKTWTLVEMVRALNPKNGLYIAYNKAIATEAGRKFPDTVECKTTHSLAYRNTVIPYQLKVGYYGYRDIQFKIPYDDKLKLLGFIESFCLSSYTSFTKYMDVHSGNPRMTEYGESILKDMSLGTCTCTHAFYLKLYHILLANGDVVHDEFDVLLLDEAGDLNAVTLAIFNLLPAKKKVMVGDPNQNIYSFNHTINGFEAMKGVGTLLPLSKSFRVSSDIAIAMEAFARDTFDPKMNFSGVNYSDHTVKTRAFISRTNGELIARMVKLNDIGAPYTLVRPVKAIFSAPLTLASLKAGGFISDPNLKHLQYDTDEYYRSSTLQKQYKTVLAYILALYKDNPAVKTAATFLMEYGPQKLIETRDIALSHVGTPEGAEMVLCTSHSSKGLEYDAVEIGDDTNEVIRKILNKPKSSWDDKDYEELRLFYVAVTRARKEVTNAIPLADYQPNDLW